MKDKERKILITGASGLLGTELVKIFCGRNYTILAQYYSKQSFKHKNCTWIKGDFSSLATTRNFLREHQGILSGVGYLINNYGPITYKNIKDLRGEDFIRDFEGNVIPAFEITKHLLGRSPLKIVINVLFKDAAIIKGYRNILPYSMAKNSLSLLTESFLITYPQVRFKNAFTPPLKGALVKGGGKQDISPGVFAKKIYLMLDED